MPFCLRQDGWHWLRLDTPFIMALDNNSQTPVYESDLDWRDRGGLTQNHLGLQEVKGHQIFRFTHICLELWARQSRFSEEFLSFKAIVTKWRILRGEERSPWSSQMCHWDVAAVSCMSSLLVPAGLGFGSVPGPAGSCVAAEPLGMCLHFCFHFLF